jgi:hypothetical protein
METMIDDLHIPTSTCSNSFALSSWFGDNPHARSFPAHVRSSILVGIDIEGNEMRQVYCAVLLVVAFVASAQTEIKSQPASESLAKAKSVSESFAKAALHVVIALHDSDGTRAGNEHIKTLFEDVGIEQITPKETAITQNLKLWCAVHDSNVNTFNI